MGSQSKIAFHVLLPLSRSGCLPSRPQSASSDHADGHGILCRGTLHLASLNRFQHGRYVRRGSSSLGRDSFMANVHGLSNLPHLLVGGVGLCRDRFSRIHD